MSAPKKSEDAFTLSIAAGDLLSAMRSICRVADARPLIPMLGHVWLRISSDTLLLTATDLDRSITVTVSSEFEGAGSITVPAHRLMSFVSLLDRGGVVKARMDGETLVAQCGRTIHRLPTLPDTDFPSVVCEEIDDYREWQIPGGELARAIKALTPAIEPSKSTRTNLQGICFSYGKRAMLAAYDGHQYGEESIASLRGEDSGTFTVPDASLPPIQELCSADLVTVRCAKDGSAATFSGANLTVRTKLLDGKFLDFDTINNALSVAEVMAEAPSSSLLTALKRGTNVFAAVGSGDGKSGGATKVEIGDAAISISCVGANGESASDVCESCTVMTPQKNIGINSRYMEWAVSSLGDADIQMGISKTGNAVTFKRKSDSDSLRVVGQMRV